MRDDLKKVLEARDVRLDENRQKAVDKQHTRGWWTAREKIAALVDEGTFVEYGGLARPALKGMEGPADGMVMGTAEVGGQRVAIAAYDYMTYAGTQSAINHPKADRIFKLAEDLQLPLIGFFDGGGARPHDMKVFGRGETHTFYQLARLSGLVPVIGLLTEQGFAGQANLLGLSDVIIATKNIALGMAGPPLVEAALGLKLTPHEIGDAGVHAKSGVIDIVCDDPQEAIETAQKYLSYFVGPHEAGPTPNIEKLRDVVPENPRRAYNVKQVIKGIADEGSILELRKDFGKAMVTSFIRIEGKPVGVVANNPMSMAGAMDSPACDKAARMIQVCDAYDIPILFLADTPGLMVGPDVEKTALVRHSARVLTAAATSTVPFFTVVLRKAYGLGYYVMGSAALHPSLLLAWPTAEFGGMGLEGAALIIYKDELAAAPDEETRQQMHLDFTNELKSMNTALESAARFKYDDVVDPADTRAILAQHLKVLPQPAPRTGRKRMIDNW